MRRLSLLSLVAAPWVAALWVAALFAAAVLAAPLFGAPLGAQVRRSPTDDVLESMKRAVNDLRYDEAIRLGRDLEPFVMQMRPGQVVAMRQVLALAHFPEESEHQHPDSSLRQLAALVRIHPDAVLPVDLSWRGLDSLLAVARERTFGFAAAPAAEYVMTGVDATGDVNLFANRTATVRLALVNRASGRVIAQDSGLVRDHGKLHLRAHDGVALLIDPGEYDLRVVATDVRSRDSIVVVRRATATATALSLQPIPALDSAKLLPERLAPDRKRTVITGIVAGLATALIGSSVRGGGTLPDSYAADARAGGVGAVIVLASVGIAAVDKGRAVPEAVQANDRVRAAHATRLRAVREENARRLAAARVTVRFAAEDR